MENNKGTITPITKELQFPCYCQADDKEVRL